LSSLVSAGGSSRDGGGELARSGAGLSTPSMKGRESMEGLSRFQVAVRILERGVTERESVARGVFLKLLRISKGLTDAGLRGSGGPGYAYGVWGEYEAGMFCRTGVGG
jgi:hypothetical protein